VITSELAIELLFPGNQTNSRGAQKPGSRPPGNVSAALGRSCAVKSLAVEARPPKASDQDVTEHTVNLLTCSTSVSPDRDVDRVEILQA
jgi:hypothetical protein